jgi:hypothetical protein
MPTQEFFQIVLRLRSRTGSIPFRLLFDLSGLAWRNDNLPEFIRSHMAVLAGTNSLTVQVLTYYVLSFLQSGDSTGVTNRGKSRSAETQPELAHSIPAGLPCLAVCLSTIVQANL